MNEAYLIYNNKVHEIEECHNHATYVCYNYDFFGISADEYLDMGEKFGDSDNYGWEMLNLAIRKGAIRIRNVDQTRKTFIDIKDSSSIDDLFDAIVSHPECFKYSKYLSMIDEPEVTDYPITDLSKLYTL